MKTRAFQIFLGMILLSLGLTIATVQSRPFAQFLRGMILDHAPPDLGMSVDFRDLSVMVFPPGLSLNQPKLKALAHNPLRVPIGTTLTLDRIEVTFHLFELVTGDLNLRSLNLVGANLKVKLDREFWEQQKNRLKASSSKKSSGSITSRLFQLNFGAVSLVQSQLDIEVDDPGEHLQFRLAGTAKEVTVASVGSPHAPLFHVSLDLRDFELSGRSVRNAQIKALKLSAELGPQRLTVRDFAVQEGATYLNGSGLIDGDLVSPRSWMGDMQVAFRADLSDPVFQSHWKELLRTPPELSPKAGNIRAQLRIRGDFLKKSLEAIQLDAEAWFDQVIVGSWEVNKVRLKARSKEGVLALDSLDATLGEGGLRLENLQWPLVADLRKPVSFVPVPRSGKLLLRRLDLRRALGPFVKHVYPLHLLSSGEIDLSGNWVGNQPQLKARAKLVVEEFSLDNQAPGKMKPMKVLLAIPRGEILADVDFDYKRIQFDSVKVKLPKSNVGMTGRIDGVSGLNLDIRGDLDLSDIRKLAGFDIAGHGKLKWNVTGLPPKIFLNFEPEVEDAYFLNMHLGKVSGGVIWDDDRNTLFIRNLHSKKGVTESVTNGFLDLNQGKDDISLKVEVARGSLVDLRGMMVNYIKNLTWIPDDVHGDFSSTVQVSGKTDLDLLRIEGDFDFRNLLLAKESFRNGRAHVAYRGGDYTAENIFLKKRQGLLSGKISFSKKEILDFEFHSSDYLMSDFDSLLSVGGTYTAPCSFSGEGKGTLAKLDSTFQFRVEEGLLRSRRIAGSSGTLRSDGGEWKGRVTVFGGKGLISFSTNPYSDHNATLDVESSQLDWSPVLFFLNPSLAEDDSLASGLSGRMHLESRDGLWSLGSGQISVEDFYLTRRNLNLRLSKPVSSRLEKGGFQLSGFRLISNESSLEAFGSSDRGNVDVKMRGTLPLRLLELISPEVPYVGGLVSLDGHIGGTLSEPKFVASGRAEGGTVRLASVEQPFEELQSDVVVEQNTIRLQQMRAKLGGGSVQGAGSLLLRLSDVPAISMKLALDSPKVKVYPFAYIRPVGSLQVEGTKLPYVVKGELDIKEALITEELNQGSRGPRSSELMPRDGNGSEAHRALFELDLRTTADRSVLLRNNLFDTELKSKLHLTGPMHAPRLMGQVDVVSGKLLFKDNAFVIQSGFVKFTNPAVLDPEFDLSSTTEQKGYKVSLFASGRVSDYKFTLRSQPALSQEDIINLLTFGVTSGGMSHFRRADRDAFARDEVYSILFSQTGINKGLKERFGLNVGLDQAVDQMAVDSAFRPSGDLTSNVAPKVVLQKEIVKNLSAKVGSTVGVGDNKQQDVNLEYRFGRNASVIGVYEDQRGPNPRNSRTSLGLDLKLRWNFR